MSQYSLTHDELERVIAYINGDDDGFTETDIASRLSRIHFDMIKRLEADVKAREKRIASLSLKLSRLQEAACEQAEAGVFEEAGYDSVNLARIIVYYYQKRGQRVSWSRVNLNLFYLYATYLAKFGRRLTVESPVAQEWGPQFWSVQTAFKSKRLDTVARVPFEAVKAVAEQDSQLVAVIDSQVQSLLRYGDETLADLFKRSPAYRDAVERGEGKWGQPLEDGKIYTWKRSLAK